MLIDCDCLLLFTGRAATSGDLASGASQIIGEHAESYCQFIIAQTRLPGLAPIRASADNLILVRRLPGGDHMFDLMPRATSVTSRQSSLAPVACARLSSTVGRTYSVNEDVSGDH